MTSFPLQDKCRKKAERLNMPIFTLIACDSFAVDLLERWIERAIKADVPYRKVVEAQELLEAMKEWRNNNPEKCKVPD